MNETVQQEGQITSPNHPADYDNNLNCQKTITADAGKRVHLIFQHFLLDKSTQDCPNDSLSLYDGDSDTGPFLGKFCGNTSLGGYKSTGRSFHLVFRSDAADTFEGFLADFTFIKGRLV